MPASVRPWLRWLLYGAAALVIAMALLVGAARLLLPLVPDYQDDIRAWASEATGYDIRFEGLGASWPISGPELSFYEVSLSRQGETQPLIAAREFSAGLSLWRLLRDGELAVGRVSVRGSTMSIERTMQGEWLVQGRPLAELLPKPRSATPEVDVVLRDITINWTDLVRESEALSFVLDSLKASVQRNQVSGTALLELPARFGGRVEVELSVPGALPSPLTRPRDFDLRIIARSTDLAALTRIALGELPWVRSASGDADLDLRFRDGVAQRLGGDVNLRDITLGDGRYERLSVRGSWLRNEGGWEAELTDLQLRRAGRDSPAAGVTLRYVAENSGVSQRWILSASFLRLDDIYPVIQAGFAGTEIESRLPRSLSGDLRELEAEFADQTRAPGRYSMRVDFDRLGVTDASGETAISGLTGSLAADGDGGRLQLASRQVEATLGQWFGGPLPADSVDGLLIWRTGPETMRFLSDDIRVKAAAIDIRARAELVLPVGDEPALIDLKAGASATQAREVLRYLPLRRFPPKVVDWLERAVVDGRVPEANVEFRGPLRKFPYESGEGVFRVVMDLEDATLDYANGWPRVEGLNGEVIFDGVSMSARATRARLGPLSLRNYLVRIPDLRKGMLAISGQQRLGVDQILGFLRATPLAPSMGQPLQRVSGAGPVDTALRLTLPITDPESYRLQAVLDARGSRLGWRKLPLDLQNVRGRLLLQNTSFSGNSVSAVMLGEPVQISLRSEPAAKGIVPTHIAELKGVTPVGRAAAAFNLPMRQYLNGRMDWSGTVTLPPRSSGAPVTLALRSDLHGVGITLPEPLTKLPEADWPMDLRMAFPDDNSMEIAGRTATPLAWDLRLVSADGGWRVDRGELHAGPGEPTLPDRRGMAVTGRVAGLRLADWLAVGEAESGTGSSLKDIYREVDLRVDRLVVAGQVFPESHVRVDRSPKAWAVQLSGPNAEGTVSVPYDDATQSLALDFKRLWLEESEADQPGAEPADPRGVPAMSVRAADAVIGDWHVGQLTMTVTKAPDGLVARGIATRAPSFSISADAEWRVQGGDVGRQTTRLEATLASTDFKDTLQRIGYGPALSGDAGQIRASLVWPGAPKAGFLAESSGQIFVEIKNGQVLEVEPGGSGRLLGLLSVTALPRRLSLDFSDVFSRGLGFDLVRGEFRIVSGSAYTCNLGLSGPVADIGIVGRAGLNARDYDQFAVVRPQMSNMLTVGGAVLGGPVGGATMLLISQLFRKPLSTLGESYYRVTGNWDTPVVDRVQRAQLDASAFKDCEKEVAAALQRQQLILPQRPEPGAAED